MAKGPGFLYYTGARGGKGQPKKTQKAWSLPINHVWNNLICPACNVTCDRKDVKIWLGRNYGECPTCYKKVHFDLHRPVGRPAGYVKSEKVKFILNQNVESEIEKEKEIEFVPIPAPVPTQPVIETNMENPSNQKTFADYVARMKEIKNPCKYLSCDDITRLTSTPYRVIVAIKRKLKYKMYKGRSELTEMFRQAVLTAIREGLIPPDLKHFKE